MRCQDGRKIQLTSPRVADVPRGRRTPLLQARVSESNNGKGDKGGRAKMPLPKYGIHKRTAHLMC